MDAVNQLHLPTCPWLVRKGMGCKSKAGKKSSSAAFTHTCAETWEEVWDSGFVMGRWSWGREHVYAWGTDREQSNCLEKVTAGGEGRGLQLVPDALRS